MTTKNLLMSVLFLAAAPLSAAEPKLQVKVFTSSAEGFSVNSTLISGESDAVLIDAQFTLSDAHRLAAVILDTRKNLTTIYITHFHPDHYFGLPVLKNAFPNVKIVAFPVAVAEMKNTWNDKVNAWQPMFGNNITSFPAIPQWFEGSTMTLEGETLQVFGRAQGDAVNNSYVWIPSIKAVVCGDIVFSGIYPWTRETTPAQRKEWIKTLDKIAALKPEIVVAGHKTPDMKDDASAIQFTKDYLLFYDKALAASKTEEEFISKVKAQYPALAMDIILKMGAEASFADRKRK